MDGVGLALFGIVQMYDDDWPFGLLAAGYVAEHDALVSVIRGQDIDDNMAIRLHKIMAGAIAQRDGS